MKGPSSLLTRVAEIRGKAPAARRAILDAVLEDPDRVLEESFEQLAERSGSSVPTTQMRGPNTVGPRTRETLPLVDALAQRQPIALDVYPYVAGSTVLREDQVDGVIDVMLTWSDAFPEVSGRLLADIAAEWGIDQKAACRRLMPGGACYFQMHEDDVERVIAHPRSMIGSDGLPHDRHPHPRLWGAFPRVFARYWRERKLFSLEQVVHKMTGMTAQTFRLQGRGVLRAGGFADVVVFDPLRIADTATYERPISASVGITAVYVNGQRAYAEADGTAVQARAGRMLARRQA